MKQLILLTLFLLVTQLRGQGLYDLTTIQTIEITFAESNWDELLDAAYASTSDYILAQSVAVNGITFDSVGVKYKGNSSYRADQTKNPFHIELDTYKDHEYEGYTDIKLSNGTNDPSFLREVLSYQILRQYMDAPLSNYANVYVNGNLLGLYSNVESISRKFIGSRFGSKENAFFECSPPAGAGPQSTDLPNLVYLGEDSTAYYEAYELKSDAGWGELIDLCDTLANYTAAIEEILDVDRALWMLAFNNVLVNLDSYTGGFSQNYYLYRSDNGRFLPVVWDLNESFGQFSMTGLGNLNSTTAKQQLDHLLHENDATRPLIRELLAVPTYKKRYLAHMKTIVEENFADGDYEETGLELQALIDASVQADGNKFYTYAEFLANLTEDVGGRPGPGGGGSRNPGITNLMDARATYLLALSDLSATEPAISEVTVSETSPEIGETVTLTTTVTSADAVYLNYRTGEYDVFTTVELLDDGTAGDDTAGDGTYTFTLEVTDAEIQYYVYAENADIGKFSPVRAAHEYYTLTAQTVTTEAGDLVINELLAGNDSIQADQDGEFDDWLELYNNSGAAIDLSGYFLTDDEDEPMQWTFPNGTTITAGGYLIVWADEDEDQAGLHANFKLSGGGETIVLSDASGTVLDRVTYGEQTDDISYGRFPNGTGDFQTMTPTYSAENTDGTTATANPAWADLGLTVTPNPAVECVSIRFSGGTINERDYQIRLVSTDGREVLRSTLPRGDQATILDVRNLPSMLYFLVVTDGQGVSSTKVLVRH